MLRFATMFHPAKPKLESKMRPRATRVVAREAAAGGGGSCDASGAGVIAVPAFGLGFGASFGDTMMAENNVQHRSRIESHFQDPRIRIPIPGYCTRVPRTYGMLGYEV